MTLDTKKALALAAQDQRYMELESHLEDLERLAETGLPDGERDRKLIMAAQDQCYMELESHLEDLQRLAETGLPNGERDRKLIMAVLHVTIGDIYRRKTERGWFRSPSCEEK